MSDATKQEVRPYRQGVNVFVVDKDGLFLIVQKTSYKDNEWNILGGGREDGEDLEGNLFRELQEETGLHKDAFKLLGVSKYKIEYDYPKDLSGKVSEGKYRGQSYDQAVVEFTGNKPEIQFNNEFKAHRWVKGAELGDYLIFPSQKDWRKTITDVAPELV